jgi:hypothetical protein
MYRSYWLENLKRRDNSDDLGEGEDNIKMHPKKSGFWNLDLIHIVEDIDRFRAFVNTVMNLPVP